VRLNLDDRTDGYVTEELYKAPGFGTGVTLESADFLLRSAPERVVDRIAPRPLLVVHGTENDLHKPLEARSLYEHASEPKRLELLQGSGHTEWMFDGHPVFKQATVTLREFLDCYL
jgi:hypothetical protein